MDDINYKIKTYRIGNESSFPRFYILNKGLNSGRPMKAPCPNCFAVTTETAEDRDRLFYLCLSLQEGQYFKQYLVGSVIPFLRIKDAKTVIVKTLNTYELDQWQQRVEKLKKINNYEENLMQQLITIKKLKLALLRN